MLLLCGAPAEERVDAEGVLDVDHHADGGVGLGEGFDGQDGVEEGSAGAAVLLGDFNAHEAEVEELFDEAGVHVGGIVHVADKRGDSVAGEVADGSLEEAFLFGEMG